MMDEYYLTKEDWDAILELGVGDDFDGEKILKMIPPAVKSSFTRASVLLLPAVVMRADAERLAGTTKSIIRCLSLRRMVKRQRRLLAVVDQYPTTKKFSCVSLLDSSIRSR